MKKLSQEKYETLQKLSQEKYETLQVEPSTTYPLLRRLEKRGMLEGEWITSKGKKRRQYYVTRKGKRILRRMAGSWQTLNEQLGLLLKEADLI